MGPHCLCKSCWQLKNESLLGVVQGVLLLVLGKPCWHALFCFPRPFVSALQTLPASPCLLSCRSAFGMAVTMDLLGPVRYPAVFLFEFIPSQHVFRSGLT